MRFRRSMIAAAVGVLALIPVTVPAAAQQPGALRVCTTGDYPPYSVRDEHGGYRGIDIDLIRGLGEILRVPVEFVPTTWSTMAADFGPENCDIAAGGISDTASRRAYADFSIDYGTDGKAPIVRAADAGRFATIEQINRPGVRVIVNPGGTNEMFARKHFPAAHLILWPDNMTMVDQLDQGRADVFVTDSVEGRYRVRQHPGLRVLHPDHPFDSSAKIFLLRRNAPLLAAEVNTWLTTQLATGGVNRAFDTWIGPHATA
ncbi:transporter substrate-binding domain-containing protein [Nocardia macrotermitis]|uniref:Cyclohexadienyl dehydratase n=1 Tax=Nocardia macrotermitis TaxID=2585198 RepID=A0A7K0D809_9NOCA|nr:transporter substrate-binding domain-containing protein [Nocardia macrotermitis]MQY21004.1 Cyclohexadienyl dehydratase [Nocardia macrotermitis]